jgi:hypothetical protein
MFLVQGVGKAKGEKESRGMRFGLLAGVMVALIGKDEETRQFNQLK